VNILRKKKNVQIYFLNFGIILLNILTKKKIYIYIFLILVLFYFSFLARMISGTVFTL